MIEHLKTERRRTQIGHGVLFERYIRNDAKRPFGLTGHDLCRWMMGMVESVPEHHYTYVVELYEKLPITSLAKLSSYTPLTKEMIDALNAECLRTRLTPGALKKAAKRASLDFPEGGVRRRIYTWMRGQVKTVDKTLFDAVLGLYRQMPTANDKPIVREVRVPLTDEMVELLTGELQRTGFSARGFRIAAQKSGFIPPSSVNPAKIEAWRTATVKSVDPALYVWVIETLELFPNDAGRKGRYTPSTINRTNQSEL